MTSILVPYHSCMFMLQGMIQLLKLKETFCVFFKYLNAIKKLEIEIEKLIDGAGPKRMGF